MNTQHAPIATKRPADQRGSADHGWLKARFTFSFAGYQDPDHMGFRSLRVMNNDIIQPGGGLGNGAVLTPGNLQYMSAGGGIRHSEFNPSETERTHLYQIWMEPRAPGGEPRYMEKPLADLARVDELTLLYAGDGRDGATEIRQDAEIFFGQLRAAAKPLSVPAAPTLPHAWLQVVSGSLQVLGETLNPADGLAIEQAPNGFAIEADVDSQFLLFRLS